MRKWWQKWTKKITKPSRPLTSRPSVELLESRIAPTASITGKASGRTSPAEGQYYEVTLNNGNDASATGWTIDWGDGSNSSVSSSAVSINAIHNYLSPGNYNINATLMDGTGAHPLSPLAMSVTNAAPLIDLGLDSSFGTNGLTVAATNSTSTVGLKLFLPEANGQFVAVGSLQPISLTPTITVGSANPLLTRYNANGTLDTSFGPNGSNGLVSTLIPGIASFSPTSAVIAGGFIYVGGTVSSQFTLVRYDLNGNLDTSFGTGGHLSTAFAGSLTLGGMAVSGNDVILAGQTSGGQLALAGYIFSGASAGQFDPTFGGSAAKPTNVTGIFSVSGVAVQTDGKIVIGGTYHLSGGLNQFMIARFTTAGALDTSFNASGAIAGVVTDNLSAFGSLGVGVGIEPDGTIVVGGIVYMTSGGTIENQGAVRVDTNGNILDTATIPFLNNGAWANGMLVQSDGKIVLAGVTRNTADGINHFAVSRLNTDLTLDSSFGNGGEIISAFPATAADPSMGADNDLANAIFQASNGDIIVGGSVIMGSGVPAYSQGLAAYKPTNSILTLSGGTFTQTGTWTDPGVNDGVTSATVDYGDGSGPQPLTLTGNTFTLSHTYSAAGVYTVTVSITDGLGLTGTTTETVLPLAPTANAGVSYSINEGDPLTLNASASTDSAGYSLTYSWTINGYANAATGVNPTLTWAQLQALGVDDGPNTFQVNVTVSDGKGNVVTSSPVTLSLNNTAPVATFIGGTVSEGSPATVSFSNQFDPSATDTNAGFRYSIALNGSSIASSYATANASSLTSFNFDDNGSYTVYGRIFDKDGGFTDYVTTITVNNVPPTAVLSNSGPINEGGSATVQFTNSSDSSLADTTAGFHYSFALSSGGLATSYAGAGTSSSTVFSFDDNGSYTVYGRIFDKDGGSTDYTTVVVVNNVAPTDTFTNTGPINEGSAVTVQFGPAIDPSSADTSAGFHYSFATSSAGLAGSYAAAGTASSTSMTYNDNGTYTVYGRIFDKDGGSTDYTTVITVLNVAPTANFTNSGPIDEGSSATVQFLNPSDPSSVDMSAGLHFSIAQTAAGLASSYAAAGTTTSATFAYPTWGTYTVYGRIFDKDGGSTDYTTTITVNDVAPTVTLNPAGSLDPTFGTNGTLTTDFFNSNKNAQPQNLVIQPDGKIDVVGSATDSSGKSYIVLARYNANGTLDTTFGTNGWVASVVPGATSQGGQTIALLANGDILVGGSASFAATGSDFLVERFTSTGAIDTTFGVNGIATADIGSLVTGNAAQFSTDSSLGMAVQSDGKIVLSGLTLPKGSTTSDIGLVRFNSNGTLDTTFGTGGAVAQAFAGMSVSGYGVAVQSNGKIVVSGYDKSTAAGSFYLMAVTRFNSDGTLDTTFGTGGQTTINFDGGNNIPGVGIRLLADDSILVVGSASHTPGSTNNATNDIALAKLTANGALDTAFGTNGLVLTDVSGNQDAGYNLVVESNGDIVVAGYGQFGGGTSNLNFIVARYTSGGVLDTTFGTNGVEILDFKGSDDGINGPIGLEANGEIIVGGYVTVPNTGIAGTHRVWGLAELLSPDTPVTAGSSFTEAGSFTDAGPDSPYTATVDYGDGSGPQALTLNGQSFTLSHAYTYGGSYTITITVTDNGGAQGTVTETVTVLGPLAPTPSNPTPSNPTPSNPTPSNPMPSTNTAQPGLDVYASGPGSVTEVKVYDAATGALKFDFLPFGNFTGGAQVAVGDVNGDGIQDVIVGAGAGGGPQVNIYDGSTGQLIRSFYGMGAGFTGGVYVAAGDVAGVGHADIIVGAGAGGGPQVNIFDGLTGQLVRSFDAFAGNFSGGVRVATGDVMGNGKQDIIAAAGPGGGPQVTVFDGMGGQVLASFNAFAANFRGGVSVAAGDLYGSGHDDIVVGAGAGAGPQVAVFDMASRQLLSSFYAMDPSFRGGINVAVGESATGRPTIEAGAGPGGGPQVTAFDAQTLALLGSFFAYDPSIHGGVNPAVGLS